ncbi:MAG: helix-turn-helix transcriptional regulator [Chloroflexota bacterium]
MSSILQPTPQQRRSSAAEIGRRVRRHRLAAGLTQAELGDPYTRAYVSAVEHGRCAPSLKVLWLFAARLEVEVGDLVDGVNPFVTPE